MLGGKFHDNREDLENDDVMSEDSEVQVIDNKREREDDEDTLDMEVNMMSDSQKISKLVESIKKLWKIIKYLEEENEELKEKNKELEEKIGLRKRNAMEEAGSHFTSVRSPMRTSISY